MIQRILESAEWTSANPTHINRLIQVNQVDNPDFEADIQKLVEPDSPTKDIISKEKTKENQEKIENVSNKITEFEKGNVGKIQKFSSEHFGNITSIANNPIGFIFGKIGSKFVRGGVIIGFILLVEQIVNFAIDEMMKPGRWLDRRLKVMIDEQVLIFTRRQELAELRQGFRTVFVTASPFIRGQQGVVGSNLFLHNGGITKDFQEPKYKSNVSIKTSNTGIGVGSQRR